MDKVSLPAAPEQGQWNSIASRWNSHGSPLRPAAGDVELYQHAVDQIAQRMLLGEALILGVTPEIYRLTWPEGCTVRALDRSREMIETVWPGSAELATLGEWQTPTFDADTFQIVFCDGGLHLLDYPVGQSQAVAELARIVVTGGYVVFRLFLPPEARESPEEVVGELAVGRIRDMNCLKLRLGHALTASPTEGVELGEVWSFLHNRIGDRDAFFAKLGWDPSEVAVIDLYRDSRARYHFVDLETVKTQFGADRGGPFRCIDVARPDHLMGDQCVHLRLEKV